MKKPKESIKPKEIWLIFSQDDEGLEWLHTPFIGSKTEAGKAMDGETMNLYGPFESLDDSGVFLASKVSERYEKMTSEWERRKLIVSKMNRKSTPL